MSHINRYSVFYFYHLPMRKILSGFLIFLFSFLSALKAQDVSVVQSDASGCTIQFSADFLLPETLFVDGVQTVRFGFAEAIRYSETKSGEPEIFVRSTLLQMPGMQGNTVSILQSEYEEIQNVLIPPVPYPMRNTIGMTAEYRFESNIYNRNGFVPVDPVWIDHIGETRGMFLGSLRISPIQFDPVRKILRKYTRLVVRVNYGTPDKLQRAGQLRDNLIINNIINQSAEGADTRIATRGKINSVLSEGTWYRFDVNEDGMYKLTGQSLLNAGFPASTDPHTIKVYSNGGMETPIDVRAYYPDDLIQNAVDVFDGDNAGQLDPTDYIVFYGKSSRGWKYNSSSKSFSHYINHFDDRSYYWITYGGASSKQVAKVTNPFQTAGFIPQTIEAKIFREDDKSNLFNSGIEWVGESFLGGGQIVYRHQLSGIDLTQPMRYKINLGALSVAYSTFEVYEHDSLLTSSSIRGDGGDYPNYYSNTATIQGRIPNFIEEQSVLRFRYNNSSSGRGYIDWYEIFYRQLLKAQNDNFSFHAPDTNAIAEYHVAGFSGGNVLVYDVSKFDSIIKIETTRYSMDTCTFQLALNAGTVKEIFAVGQNGFKTPGTLSSVQNQNLHGSSNEAEFIIVTHKDFLSAAERLKQHREGKSKNPISTQVFDLDEIYHEFGGGSKSPVAVRNFLKYAYLNWQQPPKYLLLFGDGDFDYKRIMGSDEPNWVPPWESIESFIQLSSYASDDLYGVFFTGERVNLGIGRLPVRSMTEANNVVDKIIEYEEESVPDIWKLRFTFVADDGPAAPDRNDRSTHMAHAEGIAAMVPPLFEKRKIYIYENPTVYTPAGRRKPTANLAILNAINQGSLVLNFAGHGNPRLWTHEAIFVKETDFPLLSNKGKYFFLVAATCNYAVFDLLTDQSSGELLMLMKDAGAIGVFSALRAVYADDNYDLNVDLYKYLIDTTRYGNVKRKRLGDIIFQTKQHIHDLVNDRKYFLIGDPSLELQFPKLVASVDSINHIANTQPVQLQALSRTEIDATVRDTSLNQATQISGRAHLTVYDADRTNIINAPELGSGYKYSTSGSILFRGQDTIMNGNIEGEFIVPKDISYSSDPGRIVIYFTGDSADGAGFTRNILMNGTDTNAVADNKGPQITLYLDRRSFKPGDVVSSSPILLADFVDSSGINTSGGGIGHRLEAWLDNNSESIDLSEYYKSKVNTYRLGSVEYPLGPLSNGTHILRLRAWDTYNNSSTEETMFNVVSGSGLSLSNILNYPNPISSATYFTFAHNQVNAIDAEIKIYTVAGRMIQSLSRKGIMERFVKIYWDGYDKDGDRLANGVYLYKVIAKTPDRRFNAEGIGKLTILH
ncbi:MAG: hypothetical protein C0417_02885 [Chlorobiaceae bacterium]|nr:hypothetical protein [Chlorobiaceae bacterium]